MSNSAANRQSKVHATTLSWLCWGLGAAFFAAEYFARVGPAVMVNNLMATFGVDAIAIGTLSAFFYYPYVVMQVPVGVILDSFGIRKVVSIMALVCAIGSLAFTVADQFWMAIAARVIMGFSAAFAFTGALKIATLWFESERLGLLAGLTQGMGMLGAAISEEVFSIVVETVGWRYAMGFITVILFIVAVLILIFVRDKNTPYENKISNYRERVNVVQDFKVVFSNTSTWFNAIYAALVYAPTGAFAALWGISFIQRAYDISLDKAALVVSLIFWGWAIGSPIVGWITDKMRRRKPAMWFSAMLGLCLISVIIYVPHIPLVWLSILLFLYGLTNTGVSISYAVAGEINPIKMSGLSIAFTNMCSIITTPGIQQAVGWMLVMRWQQMWISGAPYYSASDYRHAMFILPFCLFFAILCTFLVKETHCRHVDKLQE